MTKAALVDLVAGLIALGWAICAKLPWDFGVLLASMVHPAIALAFSGSALYRSYKALGGTVEAK